MSTASQLVIDLKHFLVSKLTSTTKSALAEVASRITTFSNDHQKLRDSVGHGIGFHHAGLDHQVIPLGCQINKSNLQIAIFFVGPCSDRRPVSKGETSRPSIDNHLGIGGQPSSSFGSRQGYADADTGVRLQRIRRIPGAYSLVKASNR